MADTWPPAMAAYTPPSAPSPADDPSNTLFYRAWRKYKDRQEKQALEGIDMMRQGDEQIRYGDLPSGLMNKAMGPVVFGSSYLDALIPTQNEVYESKFIPDELKPLAAAGVMGAGLLLPGPGGEMQAVEDVAAPVARTIHGPRSLRSVDTNPTAHPGWISQRLPVGVRSTEDALKQDLLIGKREVMMEPERAGKAMKLVESMPGVERLKGETDDQFADRFIRHIADNVQHLHDRMETGIRGRSSQWYPGGRRLIDKWSDEYGVPDIGIAGNIASLSPQKDWFENVSLAERVLKAYAQRGDIRPNSAMLDFGRERLKPEQFEQLRNIGHLSLDDLIKQGRMKDAAILTRSWDEASNSRAHRLLTPEGDFGDFDLTSKGVPSGTGWMSFNTIENALASLASPTRETVNTRMGKAHKVRNFYNNLLDPWSPHGDVTVDTHAAAAGLLSPLSGDDLWTQQILGQAGPGSDLSGVRGLYGLVADGHRLAAQERGIIPRAMQSIPWEGVRGLFRPSFKGNKANRAAVQEVWDQVKAGRISPNDARAKIESLAGGIAPPAWAGRNP